MKTYTVTMSAVASKDFVVRASDEDEAIEIAWERAERTSYGWDVTLPGDDRDHVRNIEER